MSEIADAIGGTIGDLFGETVETEDTAEAVAAPEAEVAPEVEESWDFEALARDLNEPDEDDEPDFNALVEDELSLEEADDELQPTEYDDEQTRALKKRAAALAKKAEYHERRHIETSRKSWKTDVRKQPWGELVDFSTIKANSRRDFNRQAKAQAKRTYEVLKPHFDRLASEKAKLKEVTTSEARQVAEQAWGRPSISDVHAPPQTATERSTKERYDAALRRGDMKALTKIMIDAEVI